MVKFRNHQGVLAVHGFPRILLVTGCVGFAEFFFEALVYVWIVTSTTHDPQMQAVLLGLYVTCSTVPRILGAPLLGVFADRLGSGLSITLSTVSRLIISILLLTGFVVGDFEFSLSVILMLIAVAFFSTFNQLFLAARAQLVQYFVPEQFRSGASSLSMFVLTSLSILSAAAAPAIYEALGTIWCLVIVLALMAVASAAGMRFRTLRRNSPPAENSQRKSFLTELITGWKICWNVVSLRRVLVAASVYGVPMGINNVVLILLWLGSKEATPSQYGIASALFGLGGVIGSYVAGFAGSNLRRNRVYLVSLLAQGIGYITLSLVHDLILSYFIMLFVGMTFSIFAVLQLPIMLAATPGDLVGRVVSTTSSVTALTGLISSLAAAVLLTWWPGNTHLYSALIIFGGLAAIVCGVILLRTQSNEVGQGQAALQEADQ